jgi:hypothetical protein
VEEDCRKGPSHSMRHVRMSRLCEWRLWTKPTGQLLTGKASNSIIVVNSTLAWTLVEMLGERIDRPLNHSALQLLAYYLLTTHHDSAF